MMLKKLLPQNGMTSRASLTALWEKVGWVLSSYRPVWLTGSFHGINQPNKFLCCMGYGNIVMFALLAQTVLRAVKPNWKWASCGCDVHFLCRFFFWLNSSFRYFFADSACRWLFAGQIHTQNRCAICPLFRSTVYFDPDIKYPLKYTLDIPVVYFRGVLFGVLDGLE
jgi:hypothetical protein